ncbi:DUF5337 domain-containing protein [Lentibacter algarum]|uniref:DUF5337 domain-containing protein n=1 Tax=Lentibacter algarum TaxID=576131 RepID=UPI001C0691EF|nr:DUF5337 domain-containing protein [Lentibacter algarum]MBU2982076.1 DUF5337 domain-containing protein [Lentibacter algarum]
MSGEQDKEHKHKGQVASLVIVITMLIWIAAQWVGPAVGLPGRYALLVDFAAIGALIWALVVTLQVWRARRDS